MAMKQLLVRLPRELVRRLRQNVLFRNRSSFEQAVPAHHEASDLYRVAVALQADADLNAEIAEWECTIGDGLSRDQ